MLLADVLAPLRVVETVARGVVGHALGTKSMPLLRQEWQLTIGTSAVNQSNGFFYIIVQFWSLIVSLFKFRLRPDWGQGRGVPLEA